MKYIIQSLLAVLITLPVLAYAKLNVLTSTTTLQSIVSEIAGDAVTINSIAKGPQDPHFIEAKPSYMVKARNADLLIVVGLDLEIGWVANIIRGSRNSKIRPGTEGHLDASSFITPIKYSAQKVDRSQGDIHAAGNPHFLLDPLRAIKVAQGITKRLIKLDPKNEALYTKNSQKFSERMNSEFLKWRQRVQKSNIKKVITHHKTLNYFLNRFDIKLANTLEPKPGIPPTAKHIMSLINDVKKQKVPCALVESFFETGAAVRVKKSADMKIIRVPTEVLALKTATNYFMMIEDLVSSVEQCKN